MVTPVRRRGAGRGGEGLGLRRIARGLAEPGVAVPRAARLGRVGRGCGLRCWDFAGWWGRSEGREILENASYFFSRPNVARRRGGNSWAKGQKWSRTSTSCTKSRQNLYQLRQTGLVQVFRARAEVYAASEQHAREECGGRVIATLRLNPHPSHETKARRMGHPAGHPPMWKNERRAGRATEEEA